MTDYKYVVQWKDCTDKEHIKYYKTANGAITKIFAVYGWYKNGVCIRLEDNAVILSNL